VYVKRGTIKLLHGKAVIITEKEDSNTPPNGVRNYYLS
jgi:hypothetical protein